MRNTARVKIRRSILEILWEMQISSSSGDFNKAVDKGNCFKEFCCKRKPKDGVVTGRDGRVSRKLWFLLFILR